MATFLVPPMTAPSVNVDLGPPPSAFLSDGVATVANAVTLVRTVAAVAVAAIALTHSEPVLLVIAYAVYWVGDMLDGWTARRLQQETRLGAVFDIISDRACTSVLCIGVIVEYPQLAFVVVPFFLSFMVLDTILSLAFLCWPIVSPNYFAAVDRTVYRLNWSPGAKCLNTAGVVLLVAVGATWVALALVVVLIGMKSWSLARVQSMLRAAGAGGPS
ncbi:CDP-alcohol phosphatidyltransferase family protein [Nocardioides zeae]|uniref:Phosphatidylglycerophosphate synthase n=1 Tax=Nocardioides zeae TaxID=1457234 RepID=A0AAJ1WZM6_9ACTN|nr:CDP-alcohol phosphatidyltransferase family protein [Nocardioides zeae]MDQ1102876.1 phosphatidylglycerophosphate synthase [Nocardioides zeae]